MASRPRPRSYRSSDDDNARWSQLDHRPGDIVISTRSKHGTTWVQMICALLVFESPVLPAPLAELSPWLDHKVEPVEAVIARLNAQDHRRIIKSHTPLDGLPISERAMYVVVARHPLDAAVSLYHQVLNLDRQRLRELIGEDMPDPPTPPPIDAWLREWIAWEGSPQERLESVPGVLHHLTDAWGRSGAPNVVLVHYADLLADLEGEMVRLADRLGFDTPVATIEQLARAATFDAMKARSSDLVPDTLGVLKDRDRFFRAGSSGAGRELLSADDLAWYEAKAAALAPEALLEWLHR